MDIKKLSRRTLFTGLFAGAAAKAVQKAVPDPNTMLDGGDLGAREKNTSYSEAPTEKS